MGEISEALRRARNAQRARRPAASGPAPIAETRAGNEAMLAEPSDEARTPIEIPSRAEGNWVARAVLVEPQGPIAEQYRHCAIRLSRRLKERDATIVAVTSTARGEGKTTTACNIALALASTAGGRRVALVELDLRRPSQAAALGIQPDIGIESVLAGEVALSDARIPTQLADLDLYPVRQRPDDPLEVISNPRTEAVLKELARRYDTVIVDTPPVLAVSDVPLLLPNLDAVLFVVTAGESRKGGIEAAMNLLGPGTVIGAFINRSRENSQKRYYRYEYSPGGDSGDSHDGE